MTKRDNKHKFDKNTLTEQEKVNHNAVGVMEQNEVIVEYLHRLKEGKVLVELRIETFLKLQDRVQNASDNTELDEKKDILAIVMEDIESNVKILKRWLKEFDNEIERVATALNALEKNDFEEVKEAFRTFILTDVLLSIRNVTMAFYDLDQFVDSTEKFLETIE